jgi:hypothetical protein
MATEAQLTANGANALHSSGPKTAAGKAASSHNHLSHGLTGTAFTLLAWEDQNAFDDLSARLELEHKPATITEEMLIQKVAQHYWLTRRAIALQATCFTSELAPAVAQGDPEKQLALYLRYQTTHDRAFHKSLNQFLKLRAEKRKAEIGFESQERKQEEEARRRNREERNQNNEIRKQADQIRREAAETRKQDLHRYNVMLGEAKFDHQLLQTTMLRVDAALASHKQEQAIEAKKAA